MNKSPSPHLGHLSLAPLLKIRPISRMLMFFTIATGVYLATGSYCPVAQSAWQPARCSRSVEVICMLRLSCPRGEMDIIQVSGTWGLGSIPGEGMTP
jgi:hypothetical protein